MSSYSAEDFCTMDEGLDYVFGRLSAIFGASFSRHFESVPPEFVRQEWKIQVGRFLTYRPSMDYAIAQLDGEFIPSAIKFRRLCNAGPNIPAKPAPQITRQPTQYEQARTEIEKAKALAKLKELRKMYDK